MRTTDTAEAAILAGCMGGELAMPEEPPAMIWLNIKDGEREATLECTDPKAMEDFRKRADRVIDRMLGSLEHVEPGLVDRVEALDTRLKTLEVIDDQVRDGTRETLRKQSRERLMRADLVEKDGPPYRCNIEGQTYKMFGWYKRHRDEHRKHPEWSGDAKDRKHREF